MFVGREEERKGLPVLLSAFAGLRQHIPVRLQVIGSRVRSGRAAARPGRGRNGRHRGAGPRRRRRAVAPAARGRRAVRTVAGRRELRDGLDRGVCRRHAGGRFRDRRLPPGRDARPRRPARHAGRPAGAGRGPAVAVARPGAPGADERRRARARRGLRLAAGRASRSSRSTGAPSRRRTRWARCADGSRQGGARAGRHHARPRARRLPSIEPAPPKASRGSRARWPAPAARRSGCRRCWACCSRSSRCGASASRTSSRRSCDSSPSWVLIALGAVLHLDDPARGVLVPHRARGAARTPGEDGARS